MSLDSIITKIDKENMELDELAELDKILDDWAEKAYDSSNTVNEAEKKCRLEKDDEIKTLLAKIAKETSLGINCTSSEMFLSYNANQIVSFNFDESHRSFTRYENSKKIYTLNFSYRNKNYNMARNLTACGTTKKEMMQSEIERYKKQIEYDKEYVATISSKNLIIEVMLHKTSRIQKNNTREFETSEDFLNFVFE